MNKIIVHHWFKIICVFLINSFLLLDIAWAAGGDLLIINPNQMLSAPVRISQQQFNDVFKVLCADRTPDIREELNNPEMEETSNWTSQILETLPMIILPLIILPVIIALSYGLGWAGDGIKETIEALYFDYGLDAIGYGLPAFVQYIIIGLLGLGLFITCLYGFLSLVVPAYEILTKGLKNAVQWLNDQRYKILIKQKVDIGKFKLLKSHMTQARKMKIKYGDFAVYINKGVLYITPPLKQNNLEQRIQADPELEANKKAGNKKTNKLQSHYLAGLGALFFAKFADFQSFAAQNSRVLAIVSIGVIILIASGFLINRLLKIPRFVRRFIHPVHERWYIWRLGLDRGNLIDMFIINRIYSTDSRKELLDSINSWMRNTQNKEKNLADLVQLESDERLVKRLSEISAKLYRMGTDAGYFKVLYWIYSNVYRVYYYRRVLKLGNNKNYYTQEFFSRVRQGLNQSALINYYLKPTLRSSNPDLRKSTINILDKFVKAGLLAESELIDIYLEVLEGPLSDVNTDAISGLIDYIDGIDAQVKVSLILKLQAIIQTQEKKVKKVKPLFSRVDDYSRRYDLQKQELLRVQALLIHIVMNALADLENQSDLQDVIVTAASLKGCFDLLGDDQYVQFQGYLNQILAILKAKQEQLNVQFKPEALQTLIVNSMPGNNNDQENQRVKVRLKQTARQIAIISKLLKQLEQTKQKQLNLEAKQAGNSNGLVVSAILAIAKITGKMIYDKKSAVDSIEQGV